MAILQNKCDGCTLKLHDYSTVRFGELMISFEHRCIFIHIPKTAGTSIEKKLGHFQELERDVQDHRTIRELEPLAIRNLASIFNKDDRFLLKRFRNNLKGFPAPSAKEYQSFYKFSFVRNPWARVFSWYRNVMRDDFHIQNLGLGKNCSLKEFLTLFPDQWALRPQMYWLKDSKNDLSLDFVGKFENLADDFRQVANRIGLVDGELPHLIVGDGKSYIQAFDEDTKQIVARRYAEEIDHFQYRFDE